MFDVPFLLGTDLRTLPWQERRDRLELLARAFQVPLEPSPLADPSVRLVEDMTDGRLEGIVLKDRTSPYRDGHANRLVEGQGTQLVRARGVALRSPLVGDELRARGQKGQRTRR